MGRSLTLTSSPSPSLYPLMRKLSSANDILPRCQESRVTFFFFKTDSFFSLPRSKTDDSMECIMPAVAQPQADQVSVCVQFEDLPCQSAELTTLYSYERNPVISDIHPKKSYLRYAGPEPSRTPPSR